MSLSSISRAFTYKIKRLFRPTVYNVQRVKEPSITDKTHKALADELRVERVEYLQTAKESGYEPKRGWAA